MRYILCFLIFTNLLLANYKITYHNLKLGEIKDLTTINESYLKVKVTNPIARFLLRAKYMILYNEDFKGEKSEKKTKYKKDNYQLIRLISRAMTNKLSEKERIYVKNHKEKYIDLTYDKKYYFKYISKKRVKTDGYFEIKDGTFTSLIEHKNKIKIIKF